MKLEEKIFTITEPIVTENGYVLIDVEYIKEKDGMYLRFYIDKPGGVTIDDCQIMSETLDKIIEEENLIDEQYIFEVSSPGIERVLRKDRELDYYNNDLVEIKFYRPIDGNKVVQGILKGHDKENIYLEIDGENKEFVRKTIAKIKRVFIFK